jgi:hypothetical protein
MEGEILMVASGVMIEGERFAREAVEDVPHDRHICFQR